MTPTIQCLRYLTTLLHAYVICHFWTPVCNVLGYWRHHSVCYSSLFTTPLVITTISVYSELWPSVVMPRSGPLISSLLCVQWSLFSVFISVSLLLSAVFSLLSVFFLCLLSLFLSMSVSHLSLSLCLICRPSNTVFASGIEDTFSHGCIFPLLWFRNSLVAEETLNS
jgi:hypothetical protein